MKIFKPTKRLLELALVLKFDTQLQEKSKQPILTTNQRLWINQERGQIMSGNNDYTQHATLEALIQKILVEIEKLNWKLEPDIYND